MLFFQLLLFGGYLYAHLTCVYLSQRARLWTHLALLVSAAAMLAWTRLVPPEWLRPQGATNENPLLAVVLLLGATVGLPYFALSSTGPLLQKWFSNSFDGIVPYRLFALSNLGSLLALLSYPFFFEPMFGATTQAAIWTTGFFGFAAACCCCAWHALNVPETPPAAISPEVSADVSLATPTEQVAAPGFFHFALWLGLPALASVVFLAVTNEVCQNVAAVPLLWIVPLSLYLVTFILAFDHLAWYSRTYVSIATVALVALVVNYDSAIEFADWVLNGILQRSEENALSLSPLWWLQASAYFAAMFVIALLCHGETSHQKPSPRYLTHFYLTLAFGGAAGGLLVNLVAPVMFRTFFEFPIALVCSCLLAAALIIYESSQTPLQSWARPMAGIVAFASVLLAGQILYNELPDAGNGERQQVLEARNFYGLVAVQKREIGTSDENFTLFSGHVQHGKQFTDPARRKTPITYYGAGSGVELAINHVQKRSDSVRLGIVGLGVGTLATYVRQKDSIRFYEINPKMVEIAQNDEFFHYLKDCPGKQEIVLGDARLQLEREAAAGESQPFDVLVIDAFSGDAIPTHLLTREAVATYRQHLKPDGILALHITNTYLDLYPVVKKLAEFHELNERRIYRVADGYLYRNYYVLLTNDQSFLANTADEIKDLPEYLRRERSIPIWTDNYTNLTRLLR